jgi:hypothetical protein
MYNIEVFEDLIFKFKPWLSDSDFKQRYLANEHLQSLINPDLISPSSKTISLRRQKFIPFGLNYSLSNIPLSDDNSIRIELNHTNHYTVSY